MRICMLLPHPSDAVALFFSVTSLSNNLHTGDDMVLVIVGEVSVFAGTYFLTRLWGNA